MFAREQYETYQRRSRHAERMFELYKEAEASGNEADTFIALRAYNEAEDDASKAYSIYEYAAGLKNPDDY